MLHEEQMEKKRKKDQEEIQKRIVEVERQEAEEREADREGNEFSAQLLTACEAGYHMMPHMCRTSSQTLFVLPAKSLHS